MIVRSWRGWADPERADAYPAHFRRNVLPALRDVAGFRRAMLLRNVRAGETAFLVLTFWDSLEAVRGFAGEDIGRAVVEPEAEAALRRFDEVVWHYEVMEDEGGPTP